MSTSTKNSPMNVRFDDPEQTAIKDIVKATGLTKGEVIRRAARYAFPRFLSGEIPLMTLPVKAAPKAKR